jgi:hypothetical protein
MASEQGRGAQVRLDDTARQLARGGNTSRLIDNIRAKQAAEQAGTAPSGNTPDGSLGNGTPADDEVLVPGGASALDAPGYTAPGSGGLYRTMQAKLGDLPLSAGDYNTATDLETAAGSRTPSLYSVSTRFKGPDGGMQFEVGWQGESLNWFRVLGGLGSTVYPVHNYGPAIVAWSDTHTSVDANFAAKGTGGHWFGNGAGPIFGIVDNGVALETSLYPVVKAGASGSTATAAVLTVQAGHGETSGALALRPLGTGALCADVPDGTTTGGDARGAYANDWQRDRSASTQIATGARSVLAGGSGNWANGAYSVIGGGSRNTTYGPGSTVSGGDYNFHLADYSWTPGGQMANDRGRTGFGCWGSGGFSGSASGEAQAGEMVLRRTTTNATQSRVTSENSIINAASQFSLPDNSAGFAKILVVARQTGGAAGTVGDVAMWETVQGIKRGSGVASALIVGGGGLLAPTSNDAGAAAWRIQCAADFTNGALVVFITGEASKNISWVCRVMSVEVAG